MNRPEAPDSVGTLDDLIIDIVANDGYNRHVMSHVVQPGTIDHPIKAWDSKMRQHSAEKYGLPLNSLLITKALAKCAGLVYEEQELGKA